MHREFGGALLSSRPELAFGFSLFKMAKTSGRVARHYRMPPNRLKHHRTSPDDGLFAHAHTGEQNGSSSDKSAFFHADSAAENRSGAYEGSRPDPAVMVDTCPRVDHAVFAHFNSALQNTPRHDLAPCFQNHVPGNDGRRVNQGREGKTLSPEAGIERISGGAVRTCAETVP